MNKQCSFGSTRLLAHVAAFCAGLAMGEIKTMADDADRAQERIEQHQALAESSRHKFEGVSATHCVDCGVPIPEVRRASLPGVQLCVSCQEINELEARHQARRLSF